MKRIIMAVALILCFSLLFSGCEKVSEENESETQAENITDIPKSKSETDTETSSDILLPPSDTVFFKPSGFENEYYFSNFFKKHMNMSPKAFRILSS